MNDNTSRFDFWHSHNKKTGKNRFRTTLLYYFIFLFDGAGT